MNKFIHFEPFLCSSDGTIHGTRCVHFFLSACVVLCLIKVNRIIKSQYVSSCDLWIYFVLRDSVFFFEFLFFFSIVIIMRISALHDEFSGSLFFLCFAFFAVFISIICTNGFINGCWSRYFDLDAVKGMSFFIHSILFLALERTCFVATFYLMFNNDNDCYNWLELHHLILNEEKQDRQNK